MRLTSFKVRVTTTGSAGVATGNALSAPFSGRILNVTLYPHASLPATADTTITITRDDNTSVDVETVATFTNIATITTRYPRREVSDSAGASLAAANKTNVFTEMVTCHGVKVAVAQADALTDAVIIEIVIAED